MEIAADNPGNSYKTISLDDLSLEVYIDFHNQRIKLLNYYGNTIKIVNNSIDLCKQHGLGKIIATVYKEDAQIFTDSGFVLEGTIDGYFKGKTGYCVSFFNDPTRGRSNYLNEEDQIIKTAEQYTSLYRHDQFSKEFVIRNANLDDASELAVLYKTVFETYPTPMNNPDFIADIIKSEKVIFKVAEFENNIVSAASADLYQELLHAEITDCATFEHFRGRGLLSELVYHLEQTLRDRNYITLFSLSRGLSLGINIVLSKHGYKFTGRLANNCNIMGKFEDMNIWVKTIKKY
ncbi:putative beta-lysine N-acetyltransferase [Desulfosporosinus nitroreducens]|uniref:Beta-lysine N-acetyltransferase n=1 Tax=Desulfosporosinus nitroreducens TaxID=2018668 RepID=A0ABT8QMM2_9FIRM|nr:putative beta-lysine N-acetyltransferase [Desulfosporosinus nitroreducens]MDO0822576.1 putative beta-lysine N-acetyltransferase [Desulfosporosinus nitroreducens]